MLRHDPARPGPTDPAEPEEEKWAVHLLLLLKATDSDDDDNDNDSELESAGDSNDQSESEVEEYSRMRSSMAVDGDEEADDEEVSDVDVAARSPANIKNESEAAKSESESENEDSNSMMDEEEDRDNDEDEDDDQPEEEDFSEGDEYVDPSSSSSSSSRRSRSHATRRQSSTPSPPASAPMTPHHHNTAPASASVVYAGHAQIKPEPHSPPSLFGVVPVSAIATHSPLSSSYASPAASSKKTRKPKYSAALEARWEEKFEWLLTYKRAKGNCRVAEGNKEYPGLGKWLSNQKTLCKKGKLKAERRQKLIDVGAIVDPALRSGSSSSAAARADSMSRMTSSSPPSSPSSSASAAASPRLGMGADHPSADGGSDDAQGPLTKRRRKGHELVVNIERIPSMSSDQEVDSAVSSPSTAPTTAGGLFSASSPFRTFQGKPILPSLSFPHPMAPGGLHPYLSPPQQQQTPQQQQSVGNGSFLSFALTAMPPTVLFPSYSILGAGAAASSGHAATPSLSLH